MDIRERERWGYGDSQKDVGESRANMATSGRGRQRGEVTDPCQGYSPK